MTDFSAVNNGITQQQKLGTAELLFRSAQKMGLEPHWVIPNSLFVIIIDGKEQYINLAYSPLNSHRAISLVRNKFMARNILERHDLPNIPFMHTAELAKAQLFLTKHTKIIAKPIHGSGAEDIHIITNPAQLQALSIDEYILEKYIVGQEFRYLVLENQVISVHRSDYGTSVQADRELERISYPESAWEATLVDMSLQVSHIFGLQLAAVDYLVTSSGETYILEVNSMPGLKWFHAPSSGPVVDVASYFLKAIVKEQARNDAHTSKSLPLIAGATA